jgi:hypothetical protein
MTSAATTPAIATATRPPFDNAMPASSPPGRAWCVALTAARVAGRVPYRLIGL